MPFRNYKCEAGHEYDVIEKIQDDPHRKCQQEGCDASVHIDFTKSTGISVKWKGGPPTPKYGGRG